MHFSGIALFCLPLLADVAVANPIEKNLPSHVQSTPDLVKRVGAGPSAYPYGQAGLNEFSWEDWDPTDDGQKADAIKIHNAYNNDWTQMIYFALQEANAVTDTFQRWFDAGDAQNVINVLQMMFDPSGVGQPTTLMQSWVCEQTDVVNQCKPGRNAYSVSNKGQFHFCPQGVAQPNASDLTCSDLDAFPSAKMKSVAFTMLHESTHWTMVGDVALGKHITDKANGASDCINLSAADKLINAQNYAFLGAEAYYKRKGCTFTDPPPGTSDADDDNDDESSPAIPIPIPPPPPYATGVCSFHLTETQDCDSNYDNNLYGNVVMKDNNKAIIGQTVNDDDHPNGYAMDDGNPYSFTSVLPQPLVITGEHENDYVQFTYGGLSWGSESPNGGGTCTVGGWDPRDGPICDPIFGDTNAVNNMDCSFPC